MKKRIFALAVVIICLSVLTGTTLAYFTTADTARNVVTSGGVYTALSGKADSSHNHAASNITSGTLAVARGGTGVTTLDALMTALGGGKMQAGTYTGTGTFGASNPSKLTFNFVPKLVIVLRSGNLNMTYGSGGFFLWLMNGSIVDTNTAGYALDSIALNSKTLTWYETTAAAYQFNAEGKVYNYIAIG